LDTLEQDILGPDYPYYKYINSPSDMGMSADGDKIATNIGGLISYVDVLITGSGKASATGNPFREINILWLLLQSVKTLLPEMM